MGSFLSLIGLNGDRTWDVDDAAELPRQTRRFGQGSQNQVSEMFGRVDGGRACSDSRTAVCSVVGNDLCNQATVGAEHVFQVVSGEF